MNPYQHILCPVDFSVHCKKAVGRAAQLAKDYQAKLTLFHAVIYYPIEYTDDWVTPEYIIPIEDLQQRGEASLAGFAERLGLAEVERFVEVATASAKQEIIRFAEEHKVDLIVLSSHARHGISRLLGSTANGVVHAAPCDVLTVRAK